MLTIHLSLWSYIHFPSCCKSLLFCCISVTKNKECCPATMNIYLIRYRQEQKILSGISWHGLILDKMLSVDWWCSTCQLCQLTKKERACKKYGLLSPKIAESDTVSLGHDLCWSGGSTPFTISTPSKAYSQLVLTMIYTAIHHRLVWNCQSHKSVSKIYPWFISKHVS
jgi:hypothetical protein